MGEWEFYGARGGGFGGALESNSCADPGTDSCTNTGESAPRLLPLCVSDATFGHTHTLLLAETVMANTGDRSDVNSACLRDLPRSTMHSAASTTPLLLSCGNNSHGQCGIEPTATEPRVCVREPESVVAVPTTELPPRCMSAGVRHSAVVGRGGWLYTFGCDRRGQCTGAVRAATSTKTGRSAKTGNTRGCKGRWSPLLLHDCHDACAAGGAASATDDTAAADERDGGLCSCACGLGHTAAAGVDGRVWVLGAGAALDNRGDSGYSSTTNGIVELQPWHTLSWAPAPAPGPPFSVLCGWSHCIACAGGGGVGADSVCAVTWGRNDMGQLGRGDGNGAGIAALALPPILRAGGASEETRAPPALHALSCASESVVALCTDGSVWSCGWNEHGNLGVGDCANRSVLSPVAGLGPVCAARGNRHAGTAGNLAGREAGLVAAGGAHVLVLRSSGCTKDSGE